MLFGMIILSIIFTLILGAGGMQTQRVLRARSQKKAVAAKSAAKAITRSKYSQAAADIIEMFNALPDSHRPGMDIESAVKALDVKYEKDSLDSHFSRPRYYRYASLHDSYEDRFTWNCSCVAEYDYDGYYEDNGDYETCVKFPEFWTLKESIQDINLALAEQKVAEAEYEKAMVLAGIQSDLGTVDSIVEALAAEKTIIDEVTKEKLEVIK